MAPALLYGSRLIKRAGGANEPDALATVYSIPVPVTTALRAKPLYRLATGNLSSIRSGALAHVGRIRL